MHPFSTALLLSTFSFSILAQDPTPPAPAPAPAAPARAVRLGGVAPAKAA